MTFGKDREGMVRLWTDRGSVSIFQPGKKNYCKTEATHPRIWILTHFAYICHTPQ